MKDTVNVIVRLAREDELRVVQDLNHKLFIHDNQYFNDLNLQWPYQKNGEEYFQNMINGSKGVCFVAEVEEQIVGYLVGRIFDAGSAYLAKRAELDNMFVEEDCQNKGVGSALAGEFKKWCKENGVEKIFVNAFSPNTGAITFYEKNNFQTYSTTLYQDLQ